MNKFQLGDVVVAKIRPFTKMIIIAKGENQEKEMIYSCRWFNELKHEFVVNLFSTYELEGYGKTN
jgi:uncharacterized protein YodC (DUF2158 family)